MAQICFTDHVLRLRRLAPCLDARPRSSARTGFTLIELLVVISIITLLISILMPSLSRAREQAKSVHCLARLKEFGTALASYDNLTNGALPPARFAPILDPSATGGYGVPGSPPTSPIEYGWTEVLYTYVYREDVKVAENYPVLRNSFGTGRRWEKYFVCQTVGDEGVTSGHYRVYLPAWSAGSYGVDRNGRWGEQTIANPNRGATRESIPLRLPLIGDANEFSERGDGMGLDECSYIDAGEANYAGSNGRNNGNRFSDRHSGGTNYLFPDLHGAWDTRMRGDLSRDYDLNGVFDIDVQP